MRVACTSLVVALAAWPLRHSSAEEPRIAEQGAPSEAERPQQSFTDLVGSGVLDAPPITFVVEGARIVQQRASPSIEPTVPPSHAMTMMDDDGFGDVVLVGGTEAYWCSGVLIDKTHVLTARHCAHATRVGLGHVASTAVPARVTHRRMHPTLDIAVLTLASSVIAETHARRTHLDAEPPLGTIRVMGFGVRDHLRLTGFGTKRQIDVAVDGWGCTIARAHATGCRSSDELFVRGGQGNDTCLGDSGGPVFERADGTWRLLAITSRGARPRKVICGEGGIYVRIDRISQWLKEGTS